MKKLLAMRGFFSRQIAPAVYPRRGRPLHTMATGLHGKVITTTS
jgi:hypothetical protein